MRTGVAVVALLGLVLVFAARGATAQVGAAIFVVGALAVVVLVIVELVTRRRR